MTTECNGCTNNHIECAASIPSQTSETIALKRNDHVCADSKTNVEVNPSAETSRDGNIDDLSSLPVSHAQVEQEVSEKETYVSPVSPSVESEKSAKSPLMIKMTRIF